MSMILNSEKLRVSEKQYEDLKTVIYKPLENYEVGRNEIVAGTVSPSYILPIHGLQRLEKIMDEYVGGISTNYMTNEPLLTRGLELLDMLKEDLDHIGAEDLPSAAKGMGTPAPVHSFTVRGPPHDVPQGDALARVLLSRRSPETRRRELALLSPCPAMTGNPTAGTWKKRSSSPHHRLGIRIRQASCLRPCRDSIDGGVPHTCPQYGLRRVSSAPGHYAGVTPNLSMQEDPYVVIVFDEAADAAHRLAGGEPENQTDTSWRC